MSELEKIETAIQSHPDPVVTVSDVIDAMKEDRSDTFVRDQMRLLERAGAVESKQVGARAVAWWHVDRVTPPVVSPEDHPDQSDLKELEREREQSEASDSRLNPDRDDVIMNPKDASEISKHADHEGFTAFRFGTGDLVDIHLSCDECDLRWIIEDVPRDKAENPGKYVDAEETMDPDSRALRDVETPPMSSRDAFETAAFACFNYLRENGSARKSDFQDDLAGEYPAGYENDRTWWRKVAKPALKAHPEIVTPAGGNPWRFTK